MTQPSVHESPHSPAALAPRPDTDGLAVSSLVLGICSFIPFVGLLCSVLATTFGAISLKRIKRDPLRGGKGMAVAGLSMGLVGLAIAALFIILLIAGAASGPAGQ